MTVISVGQISIVDVNDGLSAQLSANSVLLPADSSGVVTSYTGAETTFTIIEGGTDTSSKWTFYVSAIGSNLTYRDAGDTADRNGTGTTNGTLRSNYIKIVGLTQAASWVDITATRADAQSISRRFSVAKATTGQTGQTGTRGTLTVSRAISGGSWVDSEAVAAISGVGGGSPLRGDTVTLYRASPVYSETRVYNGSGWVTQAAYLAGSQIIDGSVNGQKITAGTILATQIGANQITTAKLAIADFTNYAANGDLTLGNTGWNGIALADSTNAYNGQANVITLPTLASGATDGYYSNENVFAVKAGDRFWLEWYGKATSDMTGSFNVYLRINNAAGSQISTQNVGSITAASTSYLLKSGEIIIPPNAATAFLQINNKNTVGTGYIGMVRLRRRNEGNLIVDGTITANKLVTDIITANYLNADSVTGRAVLANSISVEKLLVGDQNDYIPNSNFDPSGPPITPGSTVAVVASNSANVPTGCPLPYVLQLSGRDHRPFPNISRIPVRTGDKIFMSALVAMPANHIARFNLYVYRSATPTGGSISAVGSPAGQNPTTTWTRVSGVYTATAADDGKYIEPFLQLEQNSPFGGLAFVTDWHCRRQAVGELIVDGTIKTNHFTANSINGSIMTANSINANKLNVATRPLSTAGLNFRINKDGVLQWDAGKIYYSNDNGTIIERPVAQGSAAWNGVAKYAHLYVAEGATNTNLDVFDDTRLVGNGNYRHLLTWEGGSKLTVFSGISTSINGGDIVTGTIRAAQVAARSLVAENLEAYTITGNEIAADTITTNHMKAGSITTQLLAAGVVTATKLGIGNTDNIIPDADYRDTDFWQITNDAKFELFDTTAPWAFARRALRFKASGSVDKRSAFFPVEPGATYKIKVSTYVGPSFNYADGWLNTLIHVPGFMWFNLKTGKQITNADNNPAVRSDDSWTTTTGSATVDVKEHVLTIPANWDQRNIQFYFNGNVLGDIIEQAVSITRMSDATLIQNGAIQTRHITVNTLDGDVIQAGTMNANKLKADSVLAGTITVAGSTDTLSTVVARAADPASRINTATTLLDPGRVQVFGGTTLNDWRDGTDINGGKLKTGSVLASALTINSRGISTENIDFEVQTINGGQELVWTTGGYIQYISTATKAAKSVQINQASTTGTLPRSTYGVSKRCFIYWVEDETIFRVGTSAETILNDPKNVLIGTYMGGTNFNVYYGGTVINGARISTGSISADRITAGSVLANNLVVGTNGPTLLSLGNTAVWSSVSGANKPADNATVGAVWGTNLSGRPANVAALTGTEGINNANQTWAEVSGAGKPETYTVCARGNQTAAGALPANYAHGMRGSAGQVFQDTYNSGLRSDSYTRSYTVMWRSSATYWAVRHFDVYGNQAYPDEQNRVGAAGMASLLGQLANGTPVVIYTSDEPNQNHMTGGLPDLIYNCGGSRAEFGSPTFASWGAYILIGQKGIGENNGLEFRCGSGSSLMTSFSIVNGVPMFGGKTLKDAQDISYSDGKSVNSLQPTDAGATKGAPAGTSINGVAVETITGAVAAITDDNIISPAEKTALYNQQQDVVQSENKVYLRATEYINANKGARYDIQARRDALVSAKDTVLSRLSGVFTNMSTPSNVNGAVIREAFNTFYDRYALVQDSLQKLAAESGDWQQIGGLNKPADNATVGAPAGTSVAGIDAGTVAVSATNASNLSFYESVGGAGYSVLGNIVQRTTDRGGFYGNVYSQEFGAGSARVSGRLLDKDTFLGLDIDRDGVGANAYTTIQFAWHWSAGSNAWQIYENNNQVWSGTGANGFNFDSGTLFSIEYDGKSIKYYANNAVVRTIPASPNALLAVAICIGPVGARVGNVGLQVINDNSLANTDPADRINRNSTTIDGGKITTGTIDAGKINVDNLAAIKANLGSITAGKLTSVSGRTILDLSASKYEFEASEFRVKATGYNTTPFELVDGVLNLRNIAVDGGTLKNVSINTDKLQGNSVTTNAYMIIDYGGSISGIQTNVWADFDTANYGGGGGGGGGGSGGGGGGTPNVNLQ